MGCFSKALITCRVEPLESMQFASAHINTPDPALLELHNGYRIVCQWNNQKIKVEQGSLVVRVLFNDMQVEAQKFTLAPDQSYLLIDFLDKQTRIVAYVVEIYSKDEVVASWKHPLWIVPLKNKEEDVSSEKNE